MSDLFCHLCSNQIDWEEDESSFCKFCQKQFCTSCLDHCEWCFSGPSAGVCCSCQPDKMPFFGLRRAEEGEYYENCCYYCTLETFKEQNDTWALDNLGCKRFSEAYEKFTGFKLFTINYETDCDICQHSFQTYRIDDTFDWDGFPTQLPLKTILRDIFTSKHRRFLIRLHQLHVIDWHLTKHHQRRLFLLTQRTKNARKKKQVRKGEKK